MEVIKKHMGYYCPNCHKMYESEYKYIFKCDNPKIKPNVGMLTTHLECDCGETAKEIDLALLPAIVDLNKLGINTNYCCEGHYGDSSAYISFYTDLPILSLGIPKLWALEYKGSGYSSISENFDIYVYKYIIRVERNIDSFKDISEFNEYKDNYLKSLYNWIEELKINEV